MYSVVRNVDWKDLRLSQSTDLPSGTYTLTFTRTAVNKFSVSATLVLTVEETRTAHTVTFDPNGGTLSEGEMSSKSVLPGDAYGALPTPTRVSHRFDGWFTAPVGGTKVEATTVVTELDDHNGALTPTGHTTTSTASAAVRSITPTRTWNGRHGTARAKLNTNRNGFRSANTLNRAVMLLMSI